MALASDVRRKLDPGELLIKQGDPGGDIFLVEAGEQAIERRLLLTTGRPFVRADCGEVRRSASAAWTGRACNASAAGSIIGRIHEVMSAMSFDSQRPHAADDSATTIDREDAEAAYHHARSLVLAHLTTLPSVVDTWSGEEEDISPDDMLVRMCVIARDHSTGEEPFGELLETTRVKTLESFADHATTEAIDRLSRLLDG